jgi:hypothetical protein
MSTVRLIAFATCAVACARIDSPGADTPVKQVSQAEPVAPGALHGGRVVMTAVAESGNAALTADDIGEMRVWPALDGSRPPFPLRTVAPATRIAIASGDDLVVALADAANDVTVMRLGRDGTTHARAQIASDIGIEQLVFVGRDLLIRRIDHTIERYDANAARLGRLVADPGERLGAIAGRDRFVVVASGQSEKSTTRLRRLLFGLGEGLSWGADVTLPAPIDLEPLAISPDGRRIAGAARDQPVAVKKQLEGGKQPPNAKPEPPPPPVIRTLAVFELADVPRIVDQSSAPFGGAARSGGAKPIGLDHEIRLNPRVQLGFTDNDTLAIAQDALTWWSAKSAVIDPWNSDAAPVPGDSTESATADGLVVTAFAGGLALRDPAHTRYLGWSHLVNGPTKVIGDSLAVGPTDGDLEWFDRDLVDTDHLDLSTLSMFDGGTAINMVPIGQHHVVVLRRTSSGSHAVLVDARDPRQQVEVGPQLVNPQIVYDEQDHLSLIDNNKLYRYRVSFAPLAAAMLSVIDLPQNLVGVYPVDPERAGGAVAVLVGYDNQGYTLRWIHGNDAASATVHHVGAGVLAVDSAGIEYAMSKAKTIVGERDGKVVVELAYDDQPMVVAPSPSGDMIAVASRDAVELFDASGKSRWKQHVWSPVGLTLSEHGARVFVPTRGGLLALDGHDGNVVGRACGTRFGVHGLPLTTAIYDSPPVCED